MRLLQAYQRDYPHKLKWYKGERHQRCLLRPEESQEQRFFPKGAGVAGCLKGNGMRIAGFSIKTAKIPVLPIFVVGVLAGFFVMSMWREVLLENTGLFDENTLYNMKYMSIDNNALFSYVLRERMKVLLILAVLSTTYLGLVVCIGTVAWYGMSAGAFFSALVLRYGIKGIFLAVVAIFPHYLIYVPAMLALLGWGESLYRGIYHQMINPEESRKYFLKKLGSLTVILLAVAGGCVLEAYVNPYLLMGYLKVF